MQFSVKILFPLRFLITGFQHHSLAPNSIFTWEDMRNEFLNKFFPPPRTNTLMRAIQYFSEKPGEPFVVV